MYNQSYTFDVPSIERIFKGRFSLASDIKLLWKGRDSFQSIFDAVRNAQEMICIQFYIFRNDETGVELAGLLKQKSLEGKRIYLLYDHFGSFGTPKSFWQDMEKAGIKIKASRPFKWTRPFHYIHRDHRKLIIIDSEKAFTGGLNIANEYSGFHIRRKGTGWRDTGIMIEGPIVHELFRIFNKSWCIWGGEPIDDSRFKIQDTRLKTQHSILNTQDSKDGILAIPIFVNSAKGRRRMRSLLYYSINHSKKSISLTTAYFTPSRRLVETLEDAVKRGVVVRLLVPGISDVPAASHAGRAFFTRLLNAGVEIYTYVGQILHAKSYIFDNVWGIIGSTNLDFQSLRYNDEGNIGILDANFASNMADVFEEDLRHSIRIDIKEWSKRPFHDRLKEHFFSLFRRRL